MTVAAPGDTLLASDDQGVYLAVLTGNFTLQGLPVPPGSQALTGHYLTITVDPSTYQLLDLGISANAPSVPLASLGQVTNLT